MRVIGDMHAAAALAVGATIILALREPLHGWVEQLTWPELRSGAGAAGDDLHRAADRARRSDRAVRRRQSARGLADRHRARRRVVRRLRRGEVFRRQPRRAARGRGRRTGLLDRGHRRQCAARGGAAKARRACSRPASRSRARSCSFAVGAIVVRAQRRACCRCSRRRCSPPPLVAAGLCLGRGLLARRGQTAEPGARSSAIRSRFWSVVGFAVFLGVVIVLGRAVGEWLGAAGAIVGAAVVGLADVDAVTVSLARLAPQPLSAARRDALPSWRRSPPTRSARSPSAPPSAAAALPSRSRSWRSAASSPARPRLWRRSPSSRNDLAPVTWR